VNDKLSEHVVALRGFSPKKCVPLCERREAKNELNLVHNTITNADYPYLEIQSCNAMLALGLCDIEVVTTVLAHGCHRSV
jgi:hypothetical protein